MNSNFQIVLSTICICAILSTLLYHKGVVNKNPFSRNPQRLRLLQSNNPEESHHHERPVMHTFFQASRSKTGMTAEDDRRMLEIWKEAWDAAGWDTKVLVLDDAKQHPQFDSYNDDLEANAIDDYNRLCYLRWLAMAVVGGGWLCDYDVFPMPTNHEFLPAKDGDVHRLPFNGKFTVYEFTKDGGVPSMLSGSQKEWFRMTNMILDRSYDDRIKSDMFALMDIYKQDPLNFIMVDKVVKGYLPMREMQVTKNVCSDFKHHMAIHLSHFAITTGKDSGRLPPNAGANSRPQVAMDFIRDFIDLCGE